MKYIILYFKNFINICLPNEASNVDINKCGHEVLAVKSVHNASVTWDGVCKILKDDIQA